MAVLDSRLRVRGMAGLRVVDAGAMPTITSGNTNSPTLMLAEKRRVDSRGARARLTDAAHVARQVGGAGAAWPVLARAAPGRWLHPGLGPGALQARCAHSALRGGRAPGGCWPGEAHDGAGVFGIAGHPFGVHDPARSSPRRHHASGLPRPGCRWCSSVASSLSPRRSRCRAMSSPVNSAASSTRKSTARQARQPATGPWRPRCSPSRPAPSACTLRLALTPPMALSASRRKQRANNAANAMHTKHVQRVHRPPTSA